MAKDKYFSTATPKIQDIAPLPDYEANTRLLAELNQNPTARKNKYDALNKQREALERHADFLATRLEATQKSGNKSAYNAIIQQLQNAESRINNIVTEMNSIAESSRYSAEQERKQNWKDIRTQAEQRAKEGVWGDIKRSLPFQIAGSIPQMAVDAYKGIDKTIQYGINQAVTGKAGTQGSVTNPEDFYMGDVADTYIKELGKNTGTYLDALNSLAYWGATGRIGSKPDSQDERFRNMIGDAVPRIFGTKDIEDPTVAKGAEIIADPLALIPVAGRVKAGVDAVTDPKLWQGIADDISRGTRSNIFVPITPYQNQKGVNRNIKESVYKRLSEGADDPIAGFEDDYSPTIANAYKRYVQMKGEGRTPEEIFKETRVFENVDGVPYFETDDTLAKIDEVKLRDALRSSKSIPMNEVFSHPELSDADLRRFADINNSYGEFIPQIARGGAYHPQRGDIFINPEHDDLRSIIFHEMNHKSALDAGLSMVGSNPNASIRLPTDALNHYGNVRQAEIMDEIDNLSDKKTKMRRLIARKEKNPKVSEARIDQLRKAYDSMKEKTKLLEAESMLVSMRKANNYLPPEGYFAYLANNNESLARLAQERMNLTGAQRGDQFPIERNYMRKTVGFAPEETWFARYNGLMPVPVYPDNIRESAQRYLRGEQLPKEEVDLFSEDFDLSAWTPQIQGSGNEAYNASPFEIDPEYYQRYYDKNNKRK